VTPCLEVADLVVRRGGAEVLHSVSLVVHESETVAVVGPNGAGKTTLLRTVAGLIRPASGRVRILGTESTGEPAHRLARRGVCFVPEHGAVFEGLTVEENLRLGAVAFHGHGPIEGAYAIFPQLRERAASPAGTLSVGQRRMLALGRALIANPGLLMLDEPSVGLSPAAQDDLFEGLEAMGSRRTGILLVEQDVHRALAIAKRGYLLSLGSVVSDAPSDRILRDPALYAAYLGRPADELGEA